MVWNMCMAFLGKSLDNIMVQSEILRVWCQ